MRDGEIVVVMPEMGASIADGTITRWLVEVGSRVEKDQPLFEIATDKVDAEIPSPASGVLNRIVHPVGARVPINTAVAWIETGLIPLGGDSGDPPNLVEDTSSSRAPRPNHASHVSAQRDVEPRNGESPDRPRHFERTREVNNVLAISGILLGACITLAGLLGYARLAGIAGVAITVVIAIQTIMALPGRRPED